jgi:hypothetical protein
MNDEKIVSLTERRKRDMPVAQTAMVDLSDHVQMLVRQMEAQGMNVFVAACDGWTVKFERDQAGASP